MRKAEVLFVAFADTENGTSGVGEHHVVGQNEIIFGAEDFKKTLHINIFIQKGREI
jgi:hypothetical protein